MNQDSPSVRRLPATDRGRRARARLLRASEHVFGRSGYEEASIAEICRKADAAVGSFYVYFADKKEVFVELVDALGHRLRRELAEATAGLDDRFAIERAGLVAFFAFVRKHKKLYRIVRQAEFVDEAVFRRYYRDFAAGYCAALEGAMDRDEVRRLDPEVVAYCLMGMADFIGMRWLSWEDSDDAQAAHVIDTALSLVANGLTRAGAPPPRRGAKRSPRRSS